MRPPHIIGVKCPYPPWFVRRVGWGGRKEDGSLILILPFVVLRNH